MSFSVAGPAVQRGLTLLEVLVAMVIMALSLGALYQAAGGSVRGVHDAEMRTRATLFAQALLEAQDVIEPGGLSAQGAFDDFRWTLDAAPFQTGLEAAPGWPLYRVVAEVEWGAGESVRVVELATLLPERQLTVGNGSQ